MTDTARKHQKPDDRYAFATGLRDQAIRLEYLLGGLRDAEEKGEYHYALAILKRLKDAVETYDELPPAVRQAMDEDYQIVRFERYSGLPRIPGRPDNSGMRFVSVLRDYETGKDRVVRGTILEEFPNGFHYIDENGDVGVLNQNFEIFMNIALRAY